MALLTEQEQDELRVVTAQAIRLTLGMALKAEDALAALQATPRPELRKAARVLREIVDAGRSFAAAIDPDGEDDRE